MSIMLLVQIGLFGKQEENIFCVFQLDQTAKLGSLIEETMALEKSVEATERLDLLGEPRAGNREKPTALFPTFAYHLCPPKAIPMLFPRSSCQIMPEIFLPDVIPSCHRLVCTTMIARMPIAISRYHSLQLPQLSWG